MTRRPAEDALSRGIHESDFRISPASAPFAIHPLSERRTRVAVICSAWHTDLVRQCKDALLAEFERNAFPASQVDVFQVPGAFEIPLLAKRLAQSGRYEAIVGCGLIVNGGIYRHEFVAAAVIDALMRVQLECAVPVLSAVLAPRNFHEHEDHQRFFSEHLVKKGTEVAQACLRTLATSSPSRRNNGMEVWRHRRYASSRFTLWTSKMTGECPSLAAAARASLRNLPRTALRAYR
jgi:6,7-dimethyl-8-ribityllumazine synthase